MKRLTRTLSIILFALFTILPLVVIFSNSFFFGEGSGFLPFLDAILDKRIAIITLKNVLLTLSSVGIAALLALPAAWLCSRTDVPFKKTFTFLALTPLLIPSHTVAYAWMQFSVAGGEFSASVSSWLQVTFFGGQPVTTEIVTPLIPYYNAPFCAFVLAFYYFPVLFYGAYAAFKASDPLQESSALIYQNPMKVWRKITLRAAAPYLLGTAAFTFLLSFTENGIPTMLSVNTFVGELFVFMSGMFKINTALAYSIVMLILLLIAGWFVFKWLPTGFFVSSKRTVYKHKIFELGKNRRLWGAFLGFAFFLIIVVPLGTLVIRAFSLLGDPMDPTSHFSGLKYFLEGVSAGKNDLRVSMIVSPISAIIATLIALPIARMIVFSSSKLKYLLFVFITFTFLIPGTIFGIGVIQFYNIPFFDKIYSSPAIICITHVGRFLPLAILILAAGMVRVGTRGEFIARLHGVSDIRAYLDVFLPAIQFEFWLSFLAVIVFSMAELGATTLVSPAGYSTVTSALYIMMHYGNEERVSALALIQILLVLIPIILYLNIWHLLKGMQKND